MMVTIIRASEEKHHHGNTTEEDSEVERVPEIVEKGYNTRRKTKHNEGRWKDKSAMTEKEEIEVDQGEPSKEGNVMQKLKRSNLLEEVRKMMKTIMGAQSEAQERNTVKEAQNEKEKKEKEERKIMK